MSNTEEARTKIMAAECTLLNVAAIPEEKLWRAIDALHDAERALRNMIEETQDENNDCDA